MKLIFATFIIAISIPLITHAQVRITEIAWMGTSESQFGEWIEFYNEGEAEVNLSGWKIYEAGGETLIYTFTKPIVGKGYLVLERTTASSPDPLPSINDEAGTFGGSGLSNSGESLVLKNTEGETIQTLAFSGGWPAGDSESKQTMQWDGSSWKTAVPTPKAGLSGSTEEPPKEPVVSSSGGGSFVPKKVEPKIVLSVPKLITTKVAFEYSAETYLDYGQAYSGGFVWNMGDGAVYKSNMPTLVTHTYKYPGTYVISFGFYKNSYDAKPYLFESVTRTVSDPSLTARVITNQGIELKNTSAELVDISGWILEYPDKSQTRLPLLSFLAPKTTTLIPFSILGVTTIPTSVSLMSPQYESIGTNESTSSVRPKQTVSRQSSQREIQQTEFSEPRSVSPNTLTASVFNSMTDGEKNGAQKNHTKPILFGVALLIVIGLFILLERAMAKGE